MSEYIRPDRAVHRETLSEDYGCSKEFQQTSIKLQKFQENIKNSSFWSETVDIIQGKKVHGDHNFTTIRCLALGSPSNSRNALYQLAYVVEIAKFFDIDRVSMYDPVFTSKDVYLLESMKYVVEESTELEPKETLYFIPHAPLELTNVILNNEKPAYILGNDIVSHTDRYTKQKLYDTYPTISYLVHLTQKSRDKSHVVDDNEDFVPVTKRKKRGKKAFQEPTLNYDGQEWYFMTATVSRFVESFRKNDDWGNSFSDLAYHVLE